jgi:hypothetical protein
MGRPPRTLGEIAAYNLWQAEGGGRLAQVKGTAKGAQAVAFLWTWAFTTRKLGRPPTRAEQAAEWKQSEREVYRDLALFRTAFPGEENPDRLAAWMNEKGEELVRRAADALRLAAPSFIADVSRGAVGGQSAGAA